MIVPVNPKLITLGPGVESRSSFCQPSPTSENEAWTRSMPDLVPGRVASAGRGRAPAAHPTPVPGPVTPETGRHRRVASLVGGVADADKPWAAEGQAQR